MYLNCHTYFSLRYGTMSPEELVVSAKELGIGTLVLTDINNTSATLDFVRCCEREKIKPVVGIEFRESGILRYIGIAKNNEGFRELNTLLTSHSLSGKPLPVNAPYLQHAYVIYPKLFKPLNQYKDYELLGVRPEYVYRLFRSELLQYPGKLVAWQPVTFKEENDFGLHTVLRAIDLNTIISKLNKKDTAKRSEFLQLEATLEEKYTPYSNIIDNTKKILSQCSIGFETGIHLNRRTFTGTKEGDFSLLSKLALNGSLQRYGENNKAAYRRVEKELSVIKQQDFCSYFLITWDIIRYGRSMGYYHVGRGSGANSIVAFCIGITDVDPLDLDLYFERFINPYRTSPPDFDIDFSWKDRDDVLDYIIKRYGEGYTALLATYNTFKGRSIIREVGKVFGLPKKEIDAIVRNPFDTENNHELSKVIWHYGQRLEGVPNYLSIHAGGILITEQPISYYTALRQMPKGFPVTHFDMYAAEEWGFHKFDVLSQRGLGHIKDAVDLVARNQGRIVNIHDVSKIKSDDKVKSLLRAGRCMGCFYIESPAMRQLLSKLKCEDYVHLVAASSIIRPGVAKSGMMKEYIKRFHNPHGFEYLHEVFREHLGETFGVMVYQEDVMKVVHHFAGLDLDESDVLRRIMSGKKHRKETLEHLKKKYYDNCHERGHSESLAKEVWRQVESFSGYSFCKAHSASYAVESLQSLYLKAYFPLEFMVAVINNFGGFYRTPFYLHEAMMSGGNIHAPCVNNSRFLTDIFGQEIFIGFKHIKGLEEKTATRILASKERNGIYTGLSDFMRRVNIGIEQIELLIRIGAFRFTGKKKAELMWEKNASSGAGWMHRPPCILFDDSADDFILPGLDEGTFDSAFDEMELLGFSLRSPFELLADPLPQHILAKEMFDFMGKYVAMVGRYVCRKDVRTKHGKIMHFGNWLDSSGDVFDSVHFPRKGKTRIYFGDGIYLLEGKVVSEFGCSSLEVNRIKQLPFQEDSRYT